MTDFDLSRVTGITIVEDEDYGECVKVSLRYPLKEGLTTTMADVEEVLPLSSIPALKMAVHDVYDVVRQVMEEGPPPPLCDICKSPCCFHFSESIQVTDTDVLRITQAGHSPTNFTKDDDLRPGMFGFAKTKKVDGKQVCVFFNEKTRNCGIHEIKPLVCQDYSPHGCDLFAHAPQKLIQLRRSKSS